MCHTLLSTSTFRNKINALTKKTKDGYTSVKEDICSELNKLSYDEILNSNDMVRDERNFKIVKFRLKNSLQGLSKSNGYRLIYLVRKDREEVTLLYVYPKRGSQKKSTVTKDEIKSFLEDYIKENSTLLKHNINKQLELLEDV